MYECVCMFVYACACLVKCMSLYVYVCVHASVFLSLSVFVCVCVVWADDGCVPASQVILSQCNSPESLSLMHIPAHNINPACQANLT